MHFKFRPLKWSDYAQCRQMCLDNFDREDFREFTRMWKKRSSIGSTVVTYYDTIIGFTFVRKDNYLAYVTVHREFQNQKLGTLLLNQTLKALRDVPVIWLRTPPDMRLVRWYERHGFTISEHIYSGFTWLGAELSRRQRPKRASSSFFSLFTKKM